MKLRGLLFIFLSLSCFGQDYAVVSNTLLKDLSPSQIRAIFLKKLTHLNNKHLVPVNLPSSSLLREKFEKELLKMSKKRLKSYWIKQHYFGTRPPVTMKSQKSALEFVKNVQGAISYVELEHISSFVNVLYKWSDDES